MVTGSGPPAEQLRAWPLVAVIALLTATSLLNNVVAPAGYLLWAGLALVGLVVLAGADGLSREQWGLGPLHRRAAMAALGLAAVTAAVMLVGARLPGIATAFVDQRVSGMSTGGLAFAALVRAPLGTVVLEEVAFRGVLLAMLARRFGPGWAIAGSSAGFGVWHVVPAFALASGNEAVHMVLGAHPGWAAMAGMVAAGLAGALLCILRNRYDHLVVPVAVHATATSLGYALAWLMLQ